MIIKINREVAIAKYPILPLRKYNSKKKEYDSSSPDTLSQYTLTLPSKTIKGHIKLLGNEISQLTTGLGFDNLIFLGDLPIPWLYRDHNIKQAKEGLQFLVENKIGQKFNGALQVDTKQLPTFIKHLSWLIRTNAILPYVHFIEPGQNILGCICQYCNLHIYTLNKKGDKLLRELIDKSNFEYLTDGACNDKFSKSGAIKGRQIIV